MVLAMIISLLFNRLDRIGRQLLSGLSEEGQGMVEYAIMLAVVSIIAVAVFFGNDRGGRNVGSAINGLYNQSGNAVNQIELHESD